MSIDLISRAHRLEKLAKAAKDNEGDKQATERVKTALDRLSSTLLELDAELHTRRALDQSGIPRGVGPALREPFDDLRDFVANRGRPSPQKLQATTRSLSQQIAKIVPDSRARWETWTSGERGKLPLHKVTALSPREREVVNAAVRELETLARRSPSEALVNTFKFRLRQVHEDLGQVSLSGQILKVLERFTSPEGVPLTELRDEELAILRSEPEIAAQFVIRRQV